MTRLTRNLSAGPVSDDETIFRPVEAASSYDMPPSEGSLGASLWVRADTIGAAVQVGFDAVQTVAEEVTGQTLPLWDLRVVPRSAMMTRGEFESGPAVSPARD